MKKISKFLVLIAMVCLLIPTAAYASDNQEQIKSVETYPLENGDVLEVIISESNPINTRASVTVKTGSKTVNQLCGM